MIWQQDWSEKWALYSPDKVALREYESGRTLTYADLYRLSNRLARRLEQEFGIEKGDRVAVLAEYSLEYVVLFTAAQKAGFILVPLNYRLTLPELDYLLKDSDPALLFVEEKYAQLVPATATAHPLSVLEAWCNPGLETEADGPYPTAALDENDPVFIIYTSGTTGFPKGALYTHKMLFWNSINTAMSLIINSESRTINVMPPFHTGGWNVLLTPFLHHGAFTCLFKKFDAAAALKMLQEERCTLFMGVPTILQMMANEPGFDTAVFPAMHYLIVGGEPMPIPLIERWHNKGVPVRQGYGMTEVGPNLTSLHQDDAIAKKGSIGRPNFYVQIRIVDEHGQDQPPGGQAGELWLRGPMVTPGYWRNPEGTQKAFSGDGQWFRSGDMLYQDADRYLFVVDRLKNMFKSGGENVYPAEIERILLQHPAVSECAVIGVPDEKWGESGMAFIVQQENAETNATALTEYCRQSLAKFKVPKHFAFVEAIPKTDSGKINRVALKNLAKVKS